MSFSQDIKGGITRIPTHLSSITGDYGVVLEKTSHMTLAAPVSLLPYDKETIRKAILETLKYAKNKFLIEALIIAYANLPKFILDKDAEFVNEIERRMIQGIPYSQKEGEKFRAINNSISAEAEIHAKDFSNRLPNNDEISPTHP